MKPHIIIIAAIFVFASCKNDDTPRGSLDGVWESNIFDVRIEGNVGILENFYSTFAVNIPQKGDTVIAGLVKINAKGENFTGYRIFLPTPPSIEDGEIETVPPYINWEIATFNITIPKDSAKIYLVSIGDNNDTIIFEKR
ncbi:MAG: hypothetical protein LBS50_00930 [Prevotellaceae bacterium]|jgi:hypothetical protein|nr:hypothetical protein [Prevotellaceae bacterium]